MEHFYFATLVPIIVTLALNNDVHCWSYMTCFDGSTSCEKSILFGINWDQCISECTMRPWCKGIEYNTRTVGCGIFKILPTTTPSAEHGKNCAFLEKADFPLAAKNVRISSLVHFLFINFPIWLQLICQNNVLSFVFLKVQFKIMQCRKHVKLFVSR